MSTTNHQLTPTTAATATTATATSNIYNNSIENSIGGVGLPVNSAISHNSINNSSNHHYHRTNNIIPNGTVSSILTEEPIDFRRIANYHSYTTSNNNNNNTIAIINNSSTVNTGDSTPSRNNNDENDIFELMEDLKSELKFTFEEETTPFVDNNSNIPIIDNNDNPSSSINKNNDTCINQNPSTSSFTINPTTYPIEFQHDLPHPSNNEPNCSITKTNYINNNNEGTNKGLVVSRNNFNSMIYRDQLPSNLMQPLLTTQQNTGISASLNQMSDVKMYLQQAPPPNMYMSNSNNPNLLMYSKLTNNSYFPQYQAPSSSSNIMQNNHPHFCHHLHHHVPPTMNSHIKKPLNAFMLYMKDVRPKLIKETNTKDSIAINKIIGKMWQSLSKEKQAKYFEMARNEREIHRQLYPNYTTCDQYIIAKKKRRKRDKALHDEPMLKKCRARFGLDNQDKWCKPCRRKKKCTRFLNDDDDHPDNIVDDDKNIISHHHRNDINGQKSDNIVYPPSITPTNNDSDEYHPTTNIQETLNSTIISPTSVSIVPRTQFTPDNSNTLTINNNNTTTNINNDFKASNNDSLIPISNTTTTSTFNESLMELLGNISPIPIKQSTLVPQCKSPTISNVDNVSNQILSKNIPIMDNNNFDHKFNLDDDIFKIEDIESVNPQNTSPYDDNTNK